ncbi:nucleosome assembly [Cryptosporidium bovis]|uniref:nucleosome assembly n=1 Tax=Cryptosporidium bovis TaxID=310047 RepID=UPI00351A24BB|nr:nucleosome assembly [Cryptosporidium bovis]
MELDKECAKEQMVIQRQFDEKKKPMFVKRREIIEKIPKFWARTISKHPVFIESMQNEDIEVLEHLKDIELDDNLDDEGSYKIKLTFDDSVSEHMEPSVLIKHVIFKDGVETVKEVTKIKWRSESPKSRISKRLFKEGNSKEEDELNNEEIFSFFDFFTDDVNGDGIDIGDIIRRDIYHSPLFYFCEENASEDE